MTDWLAVFLAVCAIVCIWQFWWTRQHRKNLERHHENLDRIHAEHREHVRRIYAKANRHD